MRSRNFITVSCGGTGTGKSFVLREVALRFTGKWQAIG